MSFYSNQDLRGHGGNGYEYASSPAQHWQPSQPLQYRQVIVPPFQLVPPPQPYYSQAQLKEMEERWKDLMPHERALLKRSHGLGPVQHYVYVPQPSFRMSQSPPQMQFQMDNRNCPMNSIETTILPPRDQSPAESMTTATTQTALSPEMVQTVNPQFLIKQPSDVADHPRSFELQPAFEFQPAFEVQPRAFDASAQWPPASNTTTQWPSASILPPPQSAFSFAHFGAATAEQDEKMVLQQVEEPVTHEHELTIHDQTQALATTHDTMRHSPTPKSQSDDITQRRLPTPPDVMTDAESDGSYRPSASPDPYTTPKKRKSSTPDSDYFSSQSVSPQSRGLGNRTKWADEEDEACIRIMTELVYTRNKHTFSIEKIWHVASGKMRKLGFDRSSAAVKMQWTRRLRAKANVDERISPNPKQMQTGLLGPARKPRSSKKKSVASPTRGKVVQGRAGNAGARGRRGGLLSAQLDGAADEDDEVDHGRGGLLGAQLDGAYDDDMGSGDIKLD